MNRNSTQELITEFADGFPNTAEQLRELTTSLLNELYPTVYRATNASLGKFTTPIIGFDFDFIFSKQGNRVCMNGNFANLTTISAGTTILNITDSDYDAMVNSTIGITKQYFKISGYRFLFEFDRVSNVDTIPADSVLDFDSLIYFTND